MTGWGGEVGVNLPCGREGTVGLAGSRQKTEHLCIPAALFMTPLLLPTLPLNLRCLRLPILHFFILKA